MCTFLPLYSASAVLTNLCGRFPRDAFGEGHSLSSVGTCHSLPVQVCIISLLGAPALQLASAPADH